MKRIIVLCACVCSLSLHGMEGGEKKPDGHSLAALKKIDAMSPELVEEYGDERKAVTHILQALDQEIDQNESTAFHALVETDKRLHVHTIIQKEDGYVDDAKYTLQRPEDDGQLKTEQLRSVLLPWYLSKLRDQNKSEKESEKQSRKNGCGSFWKGFATGAGTVVSFATYLLLVYAHPRHDLCLGLC